MLATISKHRGMDFLERSVHWRRGLCMGELPLDSFGRGELLGERGRGRGGRALDPRWPHL